MQEDPLLRELTASEPLTLEAGASRAVCITGVMKHCKNLNLPYQSSLDLAGGVCDAEELDQRREKYDSSAFAHPVIIMQA